MGERDTAKERDRNTHKRDPGGRRSSRLRTPIAFTLKWGRGAV